MKRVIAISAAVLLAAFAAPVYAAPADGMPNGAHFNLGLLGKNYCPGDDMKNSNRHTIFVKLNYTDADGDPYKGDGTGGAPPVAGEDPIYGVSLDKTNKIFLQPSGVNGPFWVEDGNACDGDGAKFWLPTNVSGGGYQIWIAELGKPGGQGSDIRTCGVVSGTNEVVCSTDNVVLYRETGKPRWRNVTTALTTINYYVWDGDSWEPETANLFDPDFYLYFWDYDNNGLRNVQLRFFEVN
jgi:hypothetical protein